MQLTREPPLPSRSSEAAIGPARRRPVLHVARPAFVSSCAVVRRPRKRGNFVLPEIQSASRQREVVGWRGEQDPTSVYKLPVVAPPPRQHDQLLGGGGGGGTYKSGNALPLGPFHLKLSAYFFGLAFSSLLGFDWVISYFHPARQGRACGSVIGRRDRVTTTGRACSAWHAGRGYSDDWARVSERRQYQITAATSCLSALGVSRGHERCRAGAAGSGRNTHHCARRSAPHPQPCRTPASYACWTEGRWWTSSP